MLNDLYFKTTCNIRPHFLGLVGGLKIEGPLYSNFAGINFCVLDTKQCSHRLIVVVSSGLVNYHGT